MISYILNEYKSRKRGDDMPKKPIEIRVEAINQPSQEAKDAWNRRIIENYLNMMKDRGYDGHTALTMLEKSVNKFG